MEPQVMAALVAAAASLVVSVASIMSARGAAAQSARAQADLETLKQSHATQLEQLKHSHAWAQIQDERDALARAELDRHREPLLLASLDLAHRIRNIREDRLLEAYLSGPDDRRARLTRLSTLYRFARYWCVVEALYDDVHLTAFEASPATRSVSGTLRDIGRTFTDDKIDGLRLMMWREEQRAVAERMRPGGPGTRMLGYATFDGLYEEQLSPWFKDFLEGLESPDAQKSTRLAALQAQLATLAEQLDTTGTFRPQWERLAASSTNR